MRRVAATKPTEAKLGVGACSMHLAVAHAAGFATIERPNQDEVDVILRQFVRW